MRRIKLWCARVLLIGAVPVIFSVTVWQRFWEAVEYVRLDMALEFSCFREIWRDTAAAVRWLPWPKFTRRNLSNLTIELALGGAFSALFWLIGMHEGMTH